MKRKVFFMDVLAMTAMSVKAQDSVFSYTHQGTTLYYLIDSTGDVSVVPPLYPYLYFSIDSVTIESWDGHSKPQGVVVIPDSVPYGGSNHAVTAIDFCALYLCDSITSVSLPNTLHYIDSSAFEGCTRMEALTIPSVNAIGYSAFFHCEALQTITLPSTLTTIDGYAFFECHSLQSVTLPESLTTIGDLAFYGCSSLQAITLPEGLSSMGIFAFSECHGLQSVQFPSTLDAISGACFQNDTSLASVIIPIGVDTIHQWAFYGCKSLPAIVLPEGLKVIHQYAFCNCNNLQSVTLNEGLVSIEDNAFSDCLNLRDINLPNTLRNIGYEAFVYCSSLDSVYCPDSIRHIGIAAFTYCTNLTTIHLPEQLEQVNGWLLYGTNVREVVVPPHVTFIDTSAFSACQQLHKVTLPASLTTLGEYVFDDGTHLDTIILLRSVPPSAYDNDFTEFTATLIVPCGTSEAYREHSVWGRFANIVENCNGIEEIDNSRVRVEIIGHSLRVENPDCETVTVYGLTGRLIHTFTHSGIHFFNTGVYLVKVGNRPAKKIVII